MDDQLIEVSLHDAKVNKTYKAIVSQENAEKLKTDAAYKTKLMNEIKAVQLKNRSSNNSNGIFLPLTLKKGPDSMTLLVEQGSYDRAKKDSFFREQLFKEHQTCKEVQSADQSNDSNDWTIKSNDYGLETQNVSGQTVSEKVLLHLTDKNSNRYTQLVHKDVADRAKSDSVYAAKMLEEFKKSNKTVVEQSFHTDISQKFPVEQENNVNYYPYELFDKVNNIKYALMLTKEDWVKAKQSTPYAMQLVQDFQNSQKQIQVKDCFDGVRSSTMQCSQNMQQNVQNCSKNINNVTQKTKTSMNSDRWHPKEIELLLSLYEDVMEKNKNKAILTIDDWMEIESIMQKTYPNITYKKCYIKMDSLKREYRKKREEKEKEVKEKDEACEVVKWPYWEIMHKLFGKRPWVKRSRSAVTRSADGAPAKQSKEELDNKQTKSLSEFEAKKLALMEKSIEQKQRKYEEKKAQREKKNDLLKDILNQIKK